MHWERSPNPPSKGIFHNYIQHTTSLRPFFSQGPPSKRRELFVEKNGYAYPIAKIMEQICLWRDFYAHKLSQKRKAEDSRGQYMAGLQTLYQKVRKAVNTSPAFSLSWCKQKSVTALSLSSCVSSRLLSDILDLLQHIYRKRYADYHVI